MADNKTIHLSGYYVKKQSLHAAADSTLKPGMIIEQASVGSDSAVGTVQAQDTQGANEEVWVVLEDSLQGKTTADTYTAGYTVDSAIELPGSEFLALLKAGTNYSALTKLQFAGDGTVESLDSGTAKLVLLEAVDLSASGAVNTLAKVRVI